MYNYELRGMPVKHAAANGASVLWKREAAEAKRGRFMAPKRRRRRFRLLLSEAKENGSVFSCCMSHRWQPD